MKASGKLALAVLGGIAIGATGAKTIIAQTSTPPGYFVAETTVHDMDLYRKFLAAEPPISAFGGRPIIRGGKILALEGEPPQRITIVAFPSVEAARQWFEQPGHVESMKAAEAAATGRDFIVEGFSP